MEQMHLFTSHSSAQHIQTFSIQLLSLASLVGLDDDRSKGLEFLLSFNQTVTMGGSYNKAIQSIWARKKGLTKLN